MSTIAHDSWYYRDVPDQWQPLGGFIGRYFWKTLPRVRNHIGGRVPVQMYYPVWLGPENNGRWLYIKGGLHLAKSGPGSRYPSYPGSMRGPWGTVEYHEADLGSFVHQAESVAVDVFARALGAIAKIFPAKYRTDIELALTAAAAAWSAGALSGLLVNCMPALEPVLAKKIAGRLVGQVLNPRAVMSDLAAPAPPPDMQIGKLVGKLMGPLDAAAALSRRGDPADGIGNNMAAAAAAVVNAGNAATAAQKQRLKTAATAVAQMQSNLSILVTLAFTNTIRANLWDTQPIRFYGGWTPDEWFAWSQSLPRKLNVQQAPAPRHSHGRWTGVENFDYRHARPSVDAATVGAWAAAQSAPTARRDCLRAYLHAAGIPSRVADWVQTMIDASPAARKKAAAGGKIVDVLLQASGDAVHRAVRTHARTITVPSPAPATTASTTTTTATSSATAKKEHALAPALFGATLLLKIAAGGSVL